ncbi:MAG: Stp1/IreP family PP2C-type Ser/Thr phosphatase [Acidobacteriota bacterium]|nr:MAG: Stp1/IreP family PP2C-type Ser/Thr phosphatase [Acidobacteriota bacterium]
MRLSAAGKTDRGRVRPHNEDALLVDCRRGLLAVADGMGGHAAGEVASKLAVDALSEVVAESPSEPTHVPELLRGTVELANRKIAEKIQAHPEYHGMGTTLVVGLTLGDRIWIAHVGDSRAYLIRDESIEQLTSDHSFVNELVRLGMLSKEEAARDPRRNVVTRALGSGAVVIPDVVEHAVEAGDIVLLCSDGLSSMLDDKSILSTVRGSAEDLEQCCRRLIEAANDAGGEDNVTVVVAAVGAVEEPCDDEATLVPDPSQPESP